MISQTKLRSAIEGWELPSRKRPFPLSQTDSISSREAERSFSASAAAFGFKGSPSAGASVELSTYVAAIEKNCKHIYMYSCVSKCKEKELLSILCLLSKMFLFLGRSNSSTAHGCVKRKCTAKTYFLFGKSILISSN